MFHRLWFATYFKSRFLPNFKTFVAFAKIYMSGVSKIYMPFLRPIAFNFSHSGRRNAVFNLSVGRDWRGIWKDHSRVWQRKTAHDWVASGHMELEADPMTASDSWWNLVSVISAQSAEDWRDLVLMGPIWRHRWCDWCKLHSVVQTRREDDLRIEYRLVVDRAVRTSLIHFIIS